VHSPPSSRRPIGMKVSRKPERSVVITLLAAFPFYSNPLKKRKALNQQHKNFAENPTKPLATVYTTSLENRFSSINYFREEAVSLTLIETASFGPMFRR